MRDPRFAGKVVFVEDEEQADKLLEIAGQLPQLRWKRVK